MMILLVLLGNNCKAVETENGSKITYTREFTSNDNSIIFNLEGLNLEKTGAYEYALTTQSMEEPTKWFDIVERTESTAKIH